MIGILIFLGLAALFIGLGVLVLRRMRNLPLHQFAVATRKWVIAKGAMSREEYALRTMRILPGGRMLPLWSWMYDLRVHEYVRIPAGTVGLVSAKIGARAPASRQLARHVECDRFQNVAAFLDGGGEQGAQPELLRGGETYAINPEVFDVYTVDNLPDGFPVKAEGLKLLEVHSEDVGVVIVDDAPAPDDPNLPSPSVPGHDNFQKPWVFLANGGRSGLQSDILPGGSKYAINPMFARVVHIPTKELTLVWGEKSGKEERYDSELGPLQVTIQGFDLEVELTQTLSIPPHAAPHLVKRFGEDKEGDIGDIKSTAVKRFVGRVLGQKVVGYFTERTSGGDIHKFIHELSDVRAKLEVQVSKALEALQVRARVTTIHKIRFASDELNQEYRTLVQLQQQFRQREQELINERVVSQIRYEQLKPDQKRIADQLQLLIDLLGKEHVRTERLLDRDVTRLPPNVILAGGATSAIPIGQTQSVPVPQISVPPFDPTTDVDAFDISPGVLPPKDRGSESGDAN